MAMNTAPVYTLTPNIGWANLLAANANTALDGTGTVSTIFTAGANGAVARIVNVKSSTTTATSAAGVFRVWINNGSTNATATNNTLIFEAVLPSVTASATASTMNFCFPLNKSLPAGYTLICTVSTMAASSGWQITCEGADY